ncbi:MAG: ATP-binding protein [Chitinophagaceae bacterium]
MDKHYSIISNSGELECDNLATECKICFELCNSLGKQITCPKYGGERRQGKSMTKKGTIFLCDKTKTTKLFREKMDMLAHTYYDLIIPKKHYENEAKQLEQQRVNRLIHNLTSLNAHNIQEIDDFIPQELLASNYQDLIRYIQEQIKRDAKTAAFMFLRIAKHNVHMKTEFSIYRKLDRLDAVLEPSMNPIRKVILNVLHTFFIDFSSQKIYVYVAEFKGRVKIDYESIQVALYHLIENASKYTMAGSRIEIYFEEKVDRVDVNFKMNSLYLDDDEVEKIFAEGYSGKVARDCKLNGDGIGMWQINRMMSLNGGEVKFLNGKDIILKDDRKFATNLIVLTFKKS